MRFNSKDLRDVHGRLSINKEIPPGTSRRTIDYIEGSMGAVVAGVRYEPDEYRARINIACFNRDEAREVRALLAAWAASSGESTAPLEPTNWPGKAYDAILSSISAPEYVRGFAVVDVIFSVPYPFARDTAKSRASGSGGAAMQIGGTHACRPVIRQTLGADAEGLTWTMDGGRLLAIKGALSAGAVIEMDTARESLTIDGVHAEERINYSATEWLPGFAPGRHALASSDAGQMEAAWHNEWT